jgi:hypothetical protein
MSAAHRVPQTVSRIGDTDQEQPIQAVLSLLGGVPPMTVLQFKPRQQASESFPHQPTYTPSQFGKAWLCVAIGLYISPWIQWLDILSEDIQSNRPGRD